MLKSKQPRPNISSERCFGLPAKELLRGEFTILALEIGIMSPAMKKDVKELKADLAQFIKDLRTREWSNAAEMALVMEQKLFAFRRMLDAMVSE